MIKIRRTEADIPEVLNRQQECKLKIATESLQISYNAVPSRYNNGTLVFDFDSAIYGDTRIKDKLKFTQNGKCAFCESNIVHIDYGDVEHFRPKGGYIQNDLETLNKPGYYWLAYEWDNLLFSCSICNRRYKKNLFPVRNPERRALNHNDSDKVRFEKPFFINPVKEEPRNLINFKGATAVGIDKGHRGRKTIEAIGLNRKGKKGLSDLYEIRLEKYNSARIIANLAIKEPSKEITQEEINDAKLTLKGLRNYKSQYSAMIRDNFPASKY